MPHANLERTEPPNTLFYTAREFGARTKLSYATVLRLLKRKKLKSLPHCRHKRIPASELERWQQGNF
jgi:excisionase family DNA binding protein